MASSQARKSNLDNGGGHLPLESSCMCSAFCLKSQRSVCVVIVVLLFIADNTNERVSSVVSRRANKRAWVFQNLNGSSR